jgi:hypothetical protein
MNELTGAEVNGDSQHGATSAATQGQGGGTDTEDLLESETPSGSTDESKETPDPGTLPIDQRFELLRNQRRRYVLAYLNDAGPEVSLSELAEQIAAWETGKEIRQITSSERKRVYVGLYQCHLPKMAGMGVISFNKARGVIKRSEQAELLEPYLRRASVPAEPSPEGPRIKLPIIGATVLPVAILLVSTSGLALGAAALVVLLATARGVLALRANASDHEPNISSTGPDE